MEKEEEEFNTTCYPYPYILDSTEDTCSVSKYFGYVSTQLLSTIGSRHLSGAVDDQLINQDQQENLR